MTNSHPNHPTSAEPGFRHAGVDELIKDVMRITPAPNPSREAFVTVVNFALAGILAAIIKPEPVALAVIIGIVALFTVGRWVSGAKKWRRR